MKNKKATQTKYLVIVYMLILGLLFTVVVTTPLFITGHVSLTKKFVLEEDALEALLIATLLGLAYTVHRVYRREVENLKKSNDGLTKSHTEAFKYIGTVNVKLQKFWAIFFGFQRYPETKAEFRRILSLSARNVRGIVNADWILIRFINQNNFRTITEHWEFFAGETCPNAQISNRSLVEGKTIADFSIVCSRRNNLDIDVVCIIPVNALEREEKILIEAIAGELEMLFIIFTSQYLQEFYSNSNLQRNKIEREKLKNA